MNRAARPHSALPLREQLKLDARRAPQLQSLYPRVAEIRIGLFFDAHRAPQLSPQTFSYFPAAHAYFRYPCPCHSCSGTFDISSDVDELAKKTDRGPRRRDVSLQCTGELRLDFRESAACPIGASIQLTIIPRAETP